MERQCGETVWRDSVERQCGETVWRDSVERHCGETLWRDIWEEREHLLCKVVETNLATYRTQKAAEML